jgi:methyl-accepting chemotaxis protein
MHETAPTFVRWMWIWITIGALVVVVVVGFLLGIVGSLQDINDGLAEANSAVTGAGSDTKPLPQHIQNINGNLTKIDTSLKPISGQADDILSSLRSINGSLVNVDSSLKNTSGSLVDTSNSLTDTSGTLGNITGLLVDTSNTLGNISGSLVDTTGLLGRISPSLVDTANQLVSVTGTANSIDVTLKRAQSVNSLGTNAIWRRVRFLNGGSFGGAPSTASSGGPNPNKSGLRPVLEDAHQILTGLRSVNNHLTSVCQAPVLTIPVPGLISPGPC